MELTEITLKGFQCFNHEEQVIKLASDITCFVGNNGTGKTAVLLALQKLFGRGKDNIITKEDFHFAPDENSDSKENKQLTIEVVFEFPELNPPDCTDDINSAVAFANYIYCGEKDERCKMRMRLEAKWDNAEDDDDVSSQLYYIKTDNEIDFGDIESTQKIKVPEYVRKKISFHYMPAFRDSQLILKNEIKDLIKILKTYSKKSDAVIDGIKEKSEDLNKIISDMDSVRETEAMIQEIWQQIHDNTLKHYQKVKFRAVDLEITKLLQSIFLTLSPDEQGNMREIKELSDGQISLLYITLIIAVQKLSKEIHSGNENFDKLQYKLPDFSIFGFEEPESHLSPYYIGKVIKALLEHTKTNSTMMITTHAPAVIRRVPKIENIRYFRQESNTTQRITQIHPIELPEDKTADDYKYINQAVLNHPELYFAKLVILGEGDSEEIIIPQLAKEMGFDLDPSFVAFVKLGGRHVNHMWRLLDTLKIPYLTLLDLDYGRYGGGMGRINGIAKNLESNNLTNDIQQDLKTLEKRDVFFSDPLDLDMAMLQAFPATYDAFNARTDSRDNLKKAVLGDAHDTESYDNNKDGIPNISDDDFKSYRYLFKSSRGKPVAHYQAIAQIIDMDKNTIKSQCPTSIKSLIKRAQELIKVS